MLIKEHTDRDGVFYRSFIFFPPAFAISFNPLLAFLITSKLSQTLEPGYGLGKQR